MLANSSLYRKVSNGELLVGDSIQVQDCDLPPFLLGDSAYPLLSWLIKPFSFSSSLTSQQKLCNYRLSRARVVVEVAFGWLKGRWRRLSRQIDMHIDNVPHVIAACCCITFVKFTKILLTATGCRSWISLTVCHKVLHRHHQVVPKVKRYARY